MNELALPSMSTPNEFRVLNREDMWIEDAIATVHNAHHKNAIAKPESNKNEHVTVRNGEKILSKATSDT